MSPPAPLRELIKTTKGDSGGSSSSHPTSLAAASATKPAAMFLDLTASTIAAARRYGITTLRRRSSLSTFKRPVRPHPRREKSLIEDDLEGSAEFRDGVEDDESVIEGVVGKMVRESARLRVRYSSSSLVTHRRRLDGHGDRPRSIAGGGIQQCEAGMLPEATWFRSRHDSSPSTRSRRRRP